MTGCEAFYLCLSLSVWITHIYIRSDAAGRFVIPHSTRNIWKWSDVGDTSDPASTSVGSEKAIGVTTRRRSISPNRNLFSCGNQSLWYSKVSQLHLTCASVFTASSKKEPVWWLVQPSLLHSIMTHYAFSECIIQMKQMFTCTSAANIQISILFQHMHRALLLHLISAKYISGSTYDRMQVWGNITSKQMSRRMIKLGDNSRLRPCLCMG